MQNKIIHKAIFEGNQERTPFWFMRQAGRYLPEYRQVRASTKDFLSFCYDPEKACEVTLQPIRRFDMDAAILFSDILVIPDALGIPVSFQAGEGPKLEARDTPEALLGIQITDIENKLKKVYEAVALIREKLPSEKTLIGFCGAPWTVATYIIEGGSSRDFKKTLALSLKHHDAFQHLIDVLVEASVIHLSAQIKAGAEVVQIFDSWAGILPNGAFPQWCILPIQAITAKLKALHPDIPVIAFPKGAGLRYPGFAKAAGVDAVSCDMTMPSMAMKILSMNTAVQGNLDPLLLAYNKPLALDTAKQILSQMHGSRFIFNLGHGFIPETPIEHVEALSRLIRDWRG